MIDQDVHVLKETEAECRRILEEAREQRLAILDAARQEAAVRHEALLIAERERCERALKQKMDDVTAQREERLKAHQQQIQQLCQSAGARMDRTVNKLYEGMWDDGDCADDVLQPDDA